MDRAMIGDFLEPARQISWGDLTVVHRIGSSILAELDNRRGVLIQSLEQSGPMKVEHFPNFFKVVLATDRATGWSLRLNYFYGEAEGSRHSHRWMFASRVLEGCLLHTIFEADEDYASRAPGTEPAILVRQERRGSTYALGPTNVHSIRSLQPSISLVVRGPEVRSARFVDIPGIERGWSHRYRREGQMIARGEQVKVATEGQVIEDVIRILSDPVTPAIEQGCPLP